MDAGGRGVGQVLGGGRVVRDKGFVFAGAGEGLDAVVVIEDVVESEDG